jgi:hypothetical protein
MKRFAHVSIAALCLLPSVVHVGCGSDAGSESASASARYRFNIDAGSVIAHAGEPAEALSGFISLTAGENQSAQFLFHLDLRRLRFHSRSFSVTAATGAMRATPGLGRLTLVADGTLNGVRVRILGGGGPLSYSDGLPGRRVPTTLRGVLLQAGDDVRLTINATRDG